MVRIVDNIADLIGDTPLVRLNRLSDPNGASIYMKLESFNPSASVKDRAAFNMILEAEKQGKLKEGSIIIEPTSGNTGIGLAMNAAARGYQAILVMPDTMTQERINLLKAYGARVELTPGEEKMPGAIARAKEMLDEIPNSFMPMQFENMANPDAHRQTTAVEIIEAMKQRETVVSICFYCRNGRYRYRNRRSTKSRISENDHSCCRTCRLSCLVRR